MERIALGMDPDTKTTAWALVTLSRILAVGVIRAKNDGMLRASSIAIAELFKPRRIDIAVVEGQQIYPGSNADPNDLITLAIVAGGLAGQLAVLCPQTPVCVPKPRDWKGQTPKPIHQARVLDRYGLLYEKRKDYSLPAGCAKSAKIQGISNLRETDWLHVGDAVGLAAYGLGLLL